MDAALIGSAALLGLTGTPHCAAMCGAPCAAAIGRSGWAGAVGFHVARGIGYAAAGAVAAASVGAVATLAQWSPVLKPLWTLLHAAALAFGLWLLWRGRLPLWLGRAARAPQAGDGWQQVRGPARAGAAGLLWVGWPCGLLQSALLLASLTQSSTAGAAAMAAFALTSSAGLWLAPWIWQQLGRTGQGAGQGRGVERFERWAARLTGLMLVLASGWVLGHGMWQRAIDYCVSLF